MAKKPDSESAPQEGAGLSQDDADALERGDIASVNKDSDPRLAMMDKARKTRAEQMGATIEEGAADEGEEDRRAKFKGEGGEGDEEPAAGTGTGTGTGTSTSTGEGEGEAEPAAAAVPDDTIVEIEIRGEKKKMTYAEAKKHLQLGLATEDTLDAAKAKLKDAEAELATARAVKKVLGEGDGEPPAAKGPTEAEKKAEALKTAEGRKRTARKEFAKASQYGTEEEVEKATTELEAAEDEVDKLRFEALRPAPVEERDSLLDREVADTNRGTAEYVKEFAEDQKDPLFRAAASMFLRQETIDDLTKIGADPKKLMTLTDHELGEHHFRARSRGIVRPVDKLLHAAGTSSREELKKRTGTGTPPADPRGERLHRKIDAPSPPKVAAGRIPEPEGEKRPTGKDLVEEARKRRGQA